MGGLVMENIQEVSAAKNNLILHYSANVKDTSDNSTYYLYQKPIGWNEAWGETRSVVLHHLDANDSFVRNIVLVPFVPGIVPYFFMDLQISSDAVYCIFVSIQPLIFSRFLHQERRFGGSEIVLIKINMTDFNYVAHAGVSSIGDDNGYRLNLDSDGSVFIIGTTNADIASPWDEGYIAQNLTTVFVSRFQSFGILDFITPKSLSNASGYRIQEAKSFDVVLSQDITRFSNNPTVYLQRKGSAWVTLQPLLINGTTLRITAPEDGGIGLELVISMPFAHLPLLIDYSLSYDPPYIESVTPLNGPTSGNTQLQFRCLNMGSYLNFNDAEIKIGGKLCTSQINVGEYFTCLAPPGVGVGKPIVVGLLGNEGKANVTFSYDPPKVDSIQPNFALAKGDSAISIDGRNFGSGLDSAVYVTIGGRNCSLLSVTHNKITCSVPSGVGRFLDVFVSVGGQNVTATAVFYYLPPEITTIYPTASKDSSGVVVIRGQNFGNDSSQLNVLFISSNATSYQPCASVRLVGEDFSDILNCTLDGSLPEPAIYDVRVSVKIGGQTSSTTNLFETGSQKEPPVAIPQNYTLLEDSRLTFRLDGIASNVNDTLQFYITGLPINGKLYKNDTDPTPYALDVIFGTILVPSNSSELFYIPNLDFNGTDRVHFQACDTSFCGPASEVVFDVLPFNDPPIVWNHSFTFDEDSMIQIALNYSDVDNAAPDMKLIVTSLPSGTLFDGSWQIASVPYMLSNNTVNYVPPLNRHGALPFYYYSNFTYIAYDGVIYSTVPGTVGLNVRPVEDLPIATNVSVDMDRNPNLLINLECDDIDTAAWSLLVKIIKFPGIGTLHVHDSSTNGPGNPISGLIDDEKRRVWFIPPREFIGRTEFQYECLDNTGATSNTATAAISVNPIVDCVEEIVFSSEFVSGVMNLYPIDLSNRQANSERNQTESISRL
ncbi:hypothetical protein BKA69DRAFT_64246 [Paraphysoderma sedebokerense]|nr:hypothetical protein BKA69DRAFT_64246 [Paraphysoderma sedebokerense]